MPAFVGVPGPVELICIFVMLALLVTPVILIVVLLSRSRRAKPSWTPCPSCGELVAPGARFCPQCGKPLVPEAPNDG